MYVLYIVVCPFVLFLLAIVLSVRLRYTDSDYPFGIFKLFLPSFLTLLRVFKNPFGTKISRIGVHTLNTLSIANCRFCIPQWQQHNIQQPLMNNVFSYNWWWFARCYFLTLSLIPCLIMFFIITLFVPLYGKVGILLTCRKTYMTASFH
jgi:hypothetical protein